MKKMKLFAALLLGTALVASGCGNTKSEETPTQPDASTKAESPAQAEEPAPADEPEEEAADTETEAPEELSGELTYWSMWNDTEPQGEAWQEIINGFMDKYPNVKVNVQWCGRDNKKILKPALEGGEVIDIFEYPLEIDLNEYILDLSPYVDTAYDTTGGKTFRETLLPSLLTTPQDMTGRSDIIPAIGYKPWISVFILNP